MADDLLKQGLAILREATTLDAEGKAVEAIARYLVALEALVKVHGYERLDANKAILKEKIQLYMDRVELLKRQTQPQPLVRAASTPTTSTPTASSAPPPPNASSSVSSASSVPFSGFPVAPSPSAPALDRSRDNDLPVLPDVPSMSHRPPSPRKSIALLEKTVTLKSGDVGHSYASLFADYLRGAVRVTIEDPWLKTPHQLRNLVRFAECVVMVGDAFEITVVTKAEGDEQATAFEELKLSLVDQGGITFSWRFNNDLHDRCVRLSNGWKIVLGRGLDLWQKPPQNVSKYFIGSSEMALRKTLECELHFLKDK